MANSFQLGPCKPNVEALIAYYGVKDYEEKNIHTYML